MRLEPHPESPAELPAAGASFEAVFRDNFGFVYQNLRRLGVPPASIEDAVQEVFLVVLRRSDTPVMSIRGWLFGIARRIAWRQRRSAQRQGRLVQALTHEAPLALDGPGAVAEREAAALLERFLGRLDDDKRAVFLLAELEQMTAPEIARALELKENTVYSRLRAARQEFDRTFARVRLRERRATGEAALDEQALLLSRARRAHAPNPAARQRVWLALLAPAGGGLAGSGEAWAEPGAADPAQASAWTGGADPDYTQLGAGKLSGWSGGVGTNLGTAAGGHAAWAAAIGIAGALVIVAGPATPSKPAEPRGAPVEDIARAVSGESSPAAAPGASVDEADLIFARLTAAAERASQAAPLGPAPRRADPADNVPKVMSGGTSSESPAGPPMAAAAEGSGIPTAPVDLDALRREATLMADARAALRAGAWTRARELLQSHATEFPAGALVEERRLSLITALCSMGQVDAARAEAARIEGEQPGSALARKANGMCPERAPKGRGPSGD